MAIKAKNMMYTQQVQYMHFSDIDELEKQIKKNIKPKRYALILHDKDTNEQGLKVNEHVHVVLEFENARSLNNIAGLLKDNPQYIEKWDSKVKNAYSYLIHATDTAQDQWQYDVDEVRANFDYAELIKTMRSSRKKKKSLRQQKIDALLDMLYDGSITKHEIERSLSGSEYASVRSKIEAVYVKRLELEAEKWREDMKAKNEPIRVIWIYGPAGIGKTQLARMIAEQYGEYFFSGSSRDPFQNYAGQHTIILDEFRGKTLGYDDLLRITDPYVMYNSSNAPSRYFDKTLAVSNIIITSPYNPFLYYTELVDKGKVNKDIDSFMQLERRLTSVLYLFHKYIFPMKYNHKNKEGYETIYNENRCYISAINPFFKETPEAHTSHEVDTFNALVDELSLEK